MKKLLYVLSLALCTLPAGAQQSLLVDKVIAKVGAEILLLSEVEAQLAYLQSQSQRELPPDARCYIVDQLLGQKLLLNQAKLDSVMVTDEEVDAQMDARFREILIMMQNDPQQFETYYGMSVSEAREMLREDMRNQLLTQRMQGQISTSTNVTPSEVKRFFEEIPKDSLPYFSAEVELAEIVYSPTVSEAEHDKARQKAEGLRRRIVEGGEDFADLATRFSEDRGSARLGGDLGWQGRGSFVSEFEGAAYNLDPMEVSDVVETEFGFHIIQLLERRGNLLHLRHILVMPAITEADIERAAVLLDSVRQLIVTDSMSFSEAVKKFSSDKVQSYHNDGIMVNPRSGNGFWEMGDLEPDVYFAIESMAVGEVSEPLRFVDYRGNTMFRIVQLREQTEPHQASLEIDYSKIKTAAMEQKKSRELSDWVTRTAANTTIRLDEMFQDCELLRKWQSPKP